MIERYINPFFFNKLLKEVKDGQGKEGYYINIF